MMANNGNGKTAEALHDLQIFPILTEEVDRVGAPAGASGAGGGGTLGATVTNALRDVLGWKAKANDPKGFVAALNQSFSGAQVDGHTAWTWTPRTYAVQADLGAVTGAQASLYSRAKNALDQSLPLLDGLYSLQEDADPQDLDAIRLLVRSELTELVNEFGVTGGPRVERVNKLFALLVNDDPRVDPVLPASINDVSGHLRILRDRFAIDGVNVNTIIEEQNQTNYLILADYIISLLRSWQEIEPSFDRAGDAAFLGTQLVLLSRDLTVLSESVQEAYAAMDSVFLGAAERETTELHLVIDRPDPLPDIDTRITIAELLRWVDTFATLEGPRILQDGGKDGVVLAFRPMLEQLQDLVNAAAILSENKTHNPSAAFHTKRVAFALQQVKEAISTTLDDTEGIRRSPDPRIIGVSPPSAPANRDVTLRIVGVNFLPGARAFLTRPTVADPRIEERIPSTSLFGTETEVMVVFDLRGRSGTWTVRVENPNRQAGVLLNGFSIDQYSPQFPSSPAPPVTPAPTPPAVLWEPEVFEVVPPYGAPRNTDIEFTVKGKDFPQGATVNFGEFIDARNFDVPDDTTITGTLRIRQNAKPGPTEVGVYDQNDTLLAKKSDAFQIGQDPWHDGTSHIA